MLRPAPGTRRDTSARLVAVAELTAHRETIMSDVTRRKALQLLAGAGAVTAAGCVERNRGKETMPQPPTPPAAHADPKTTPQTAAAPAADPVLAVRPLSTPWQTRDPFLFCMHHHDQYPKGNGRFGPAASLAGRQHGSDFAGVDGWNMYHGDKVPGFPAHPHRGFETVTVVRTGLLDHADSLGAAARYGGGDVQWLTAGRGIQHAEMFPLLRQDQDNPLELFQIWLNLPADKKFTLPHFSMLWNDSIPTVHVKDDAGRSTELRVVAGRVGDKVAPSPPPNSWAAAADSDVAIWTLKMAPGASWTLPTTGADRNRTLYVFRGSSVQVGPRKVARGHLVEIRADVATRLVAGPDETELLMLQGRPIGEPVAQHGPFVMNTRAEIQQAYADYRKTRFGGWPWPNDEPVHGADGQRFARRPDGTVERPA